MNKILKITLIGINFRFLDKPEVKEFIVQSEQEGIIVNEISKIIELDEKNSWMDDDGKAIPGTQFRYRNEMWMTAKSSVKLKKDIEKAIG